MSVHNSKLNPIISTHMFLTKRIIYTMFSSPPWLFLHVNVYLSFHRVSSSLLFPIFSSIPPLSFQTYVLYVNSCLEYIKHVKNQVIFVYSELVDMYTYVAADWAALIQGGTPAQAKGHTRQVSLSGPATDNWSARHRTAAGQLINNSC